MPRFLSYVCSSAREAGLQAPHSIEVACVARDQHELMLEGGGRNQSVGRSETACAAESAGALRNRAIDGYFIEWFE